MRLWQKETCLLWRNPSLGMESLTCKATGKTQSTDCAEITPLSSTQWEDVKEIQSQAAMTAKPDSLKSTRISVSTTE